MQKMEESKNNTTLAKIMANQSRKRTLESLLIKDEQIAGTQRTMPPLLIKDKKIAGTQSQPEVLADHILILENDLAPTLPNSPTMKGLQAAIDQSKVEELEKTVENLKAMHETLDYEALCYYFSIRRIKEENEQMKAYGQAADKLLTEKDAELRGLILKRQRLEYNLGYWFGLPFPWTHYKPYP